MRDDMACSSLRLAWHYLGGVGALVVLIMALFGLIAVIGVVAIIIDGSQARVRTSARVIDKGKVFNPQPPTPKAKGPPQPVDPFAYWLKYTYQDQSGQAHTSQVFLASAAWNQHETGSTVTVEYVEARPEESRLDIGGHSSPWLGVMITLGIGLLLLGLSLLATVSAWRDVAPRIRLIRNGIPAVGRVTHVVAKDPPMVVKGQQPRMNYVLQFRFSTPDGQEFAGESVPLSDRQLRWQPGEPILILYHPANPSVHEPDLFGTRADDLRLMVAGPEVIAGTVKLRDSLAGTVWAYSWRGKEFEFSFGKSGELQLLTIWQSVHWRVVSPNEVVLETPSAHMLLRFDANLEQFTTVDWDGEPANGQLRDKTTT
jgi:hypothetical protein